MQSERDVLPEVVRAHVHVHVHAQPHPIHRETQGGCQRRGGSSGEWRSQRLTMVGGLGAYLRRLRKHEEELENDVDDEDGLQKARTTRADDVSAITQRGRRRSRRGRDVRAACRNGGHGTLQRRAQPQGMG